MFSVIMPSERAAAEFIEFFRLLFRPEGLTKQFACATKPFSVLAQMSGNSRRLSRRQPDGRCRPRTIGDNQMRTTSFILAFAFILAGPSMAGSTDQHLPGVGTFAYHGSPVANPASRSIVVAVK
jgi:hypothetical protein